MRVLWLTPDKPDDISVGRQRIATRLRRRGWTVTLRGTTLTTVWASLRELHTYDVFVGTTHAGAIAGMLLREVGNLPFIVDHIDPIRQFARDNSAPTAAVVRALENLTFRQADHVLYVYDEEADRVNRHSRAVTETALGVEYDRLTDPSRVAVLRARERLSEERLAPNIAIYVGGLEPIYNVEEMLDSVEYLEEWSLLIVGTGSLVDRVTDAAARNDSIVYLGTVPHETVPGYLHAADVGLSLVDDPHTLKVLEYAAAGLPVVQLRGRAESQFGDLVTYCAPDPAAVAAAIERAREDQSTDALREFAAGFEWAEIAATYGEVIEAVAGGWGCSPEA